MIYLLRTYLYACDQCGQEEQLSVKHNPLSSNEPLELPEGWYMKGIQTRFILDRRVLLCGSCAEVQKMANLEAQYPWTRPSEDGLLPDGSQP